MAKNKPAKRSSKSPTPATLTGLRNQIDRLDQQLVKLINERAQFALEIGKLKDQEGQTIYRPGREEEVLAQVLASSTGPLSQDCVRAVFREIISGSRALERMLKVTYLGPAYTYSHLACLHRFGECVEMIPVATIPAVFDEVSRGHADLGIVPLENSTDGRVADTLDMFTKMPLKICGEVQLWIHHNLLARCPRSEVREVYSKPQALSQCRNWLAKHLPGARSIEVTSTATAAQLAQEREGAAAIASSQAAQHYNLEVLAENIEDSTANLTRFAVIGQQSAERTGNDITALMFEVAHRPGGLADALVVFKRNRLNLTWIESFPIARPARGYMFFVELDGHESDLRVRKTIDSLTKRTVRLEILGSYPRSVPIG